jgi:protein tyrosine/serine phosphatase
MFDAPDTLPFQAQSETSRGAAERMRPTASTDRAAVLALLTRKLSGMTDEEIQRALKLNPSTERPRRIELVQAGKVRDSGRTRKTKSGRAATVWEAVSE